MFYSYLYGFLNTFYLILLRDIFTYFIYFYLQTKKTNKHSKNGFDKIQIMISYHIIICSVLKFDKVTFSFIFVSALLIKVKYKIC